MCTESLPATLITPGTLQTGGTITPTVDNSYAFGSASKTWNSAYVQTLFVTNLDSSANAGNFIYSNLQIKPVADTTYDLGASGLRWATFYATTIRFYSAVATAVNGLNWGASQGVQANLYYNGNNNAGVASGGFLRTDGTLSALHYLCNGGTPTVMCGPGAGTVGTPTCSTTGTDCSGQLTVVTSTVATVTAMIANVTFSTPYTGVGINAVLLQEASNTATLVRVYVQFQNNVVWRLNSNTAGLLDSTTYIWNWAARAQE